MKPHNMHTLTLVIILAIGGWLFYATRGSVMLQLLIGLVTSASYIAWGIIHHVIIGDLHPKVVIEYVLVGSIAMILLFIVLG